MFKMTDQRSRQLAHTALTVLRITLGVFWLLQLSWKPPPTFGCPNGGLCLWLDIEIAKPVIPLYAEFVKAIVRPNAILFGWITTFVEAGIGLSLVFGAFTRLGALVGVAWSFNLLLGLANHSDEAGWYYGMLIMLNILFVAIGASGQLSIDRMRGWKLWWGRAGETVT